MSAPLPAGWVRTGDGGAYLYGGPACPDDPRIVATDGAGGPGRASTVAYHCAACPGHRLPLLDRTGVPWPVQGPHPLTALVHDELWEWPCPSCTGRQ